MFKGAIQSSISTSNERKKGIQYTYDIFFIEQLSNFIYYFQTIYFLLLLHKISFAYK